MSLWKKSSATGVMNPSAHLWRIFVACHVGLVKLPSKFQLSEQQFFLPCSFKCAIRTHTWQEGTQGTTETLINVAEFAETSVYFSKLRQTYAVMLPAWTVHQVVTWKRRECTRVSGNASSAASTSGSWKLLSFPDSGRTFRLAFTVLQPRFSEVAV